MTEASMKFSADANLYLRTFPLASVEHGYSLSEIKCLWETITSSLCTGWWQGGHFPTEQISGSSSEWLPFWNITISVFLHIVSCPFPKSSRQKNASGWKAEILQHDSCPGFWFQKSKLVEEVVTRTTRGEEKSHRMRWAQGWVAWAVGTGTRLLKVPHRWHSLTVELPGRLYPQLSGS